MRFLVDHMLTNAASQFPDRDAVVFGERRISYAQFDQCVTRCANRLVESGLKRGDRVGVLLQPGLNLPIWIFAVIRAGGVVVPIHHSLFPEQVRHILSDCAAYGLITDSHRHEQLAEVIVALNVVSLIDNEPTVSSACDSESSFESTDFLRPIGCDLAAILYTSGSTGRPKGVMLSHANIIAGAEIVADYLSLSHEDRILGALPLSFDAGLNQLTSAVSCGATIVMVAFRFGRDIVQALEKERITGLAAVPPLWNLLSQRSSGLHRIDLPALRYITNTGGALPSHVLDELRDALPGVEVYLMYGLTEAFRSTYLPPQDLDRKPGSIGKAIPNTEIIVVNDEGKRCQPGEIGELVHRGPTVSLGYWGRPELSRQVLRPNPFASDQCDSVEQVVYSGDLVRMDDEGYLFFVGRRDNQIKSAGFRISPNEVEQVLCESPEVQQAAVVGVPNEVLGQHLEAFVTRSGQQIINESCLIGFCGERLPRHMIPKRIHCIDVLPMTSSGKIDYPSLARQAIDQGVGCE